MLKLIFAFIFFIPAFAVRSFGQDALPNILVKNYNGKIIISWKNTYTNHINHINIQRSNDSLRNFNTIANVLDPMNEENGVVDPKPTNKNMFYRVFVAFEGGTYVYSKSQRPVIDTFKSNPTTANTIAANITDTTNTNEYRAPAPAPYVYGKFIYTGKDNNVIINLPEATTHKYSIKFFDDKDDPVFEVRSVPEPYLILDKVNFIHSGWFNYTLFDNGILLEKYKIFIPKGGK
jgi:hypothetical protein